jgi:hypothetical protein
MITQLINAVTQTGIQQKAVAKVDLQFPLMTRTAEEMTLPTILDCTGNVSTTTIYVNKKKKKKEKWVVVRDTTGGWNRIYHRF